MAASVVSPQSGSCAAGAIVFKRSGATPSGWVKDFTDSDVSVADHETGTVRVAVLSDSRVVALSSGCDKELSARVYGANPSFELESESQDLVIEFGTQSTVPYGYFDIVAGTAKTAYISFFSFSPNPIQGSWPVTKQSAHLRMSVNTGFGSNPTFDLVEEQSGYTSNAPHKVGTRLRLGGSSCGSHVRAVGGPLFTTGLQFGLLPPPLDISTTWAVQNFAVDDSGDGEPDYCCE